MRFNRRGFMLSLTISATLAAAHQVDSADVVSSWTGGAGNWSLAANWSNTPSVAFYPNNGNGAFSYDAIIGPTSTVTLTEPITIEKLDLLGHATLNGSANLTANQKITLSGVVFLLGSGQINANGGIDTLGAGPSFLDGRSLVVAGNTTSTLDHKITLTNSAAVTLNGATVLNNGGAFDGDANCAWANNGTLLKNANNWAQFHDPRFTNSGTVSVNGGSLTIYNANTHTGTFVVASGATLQANGDFSSTSRVNVAAGGNLDFVPTGQRIFDGTLSAAGANVGVTIGASDFVRKLTFSATSNINIDNANLWGFGQAIDFNNLQELNPANVTIDSASANFFNPRLNVSGTFTVGAFSQNVIETTSAGANRSFIQNLDMSAANDNSFFNVHSEAVVHDVYQNGGILAAEGSLLISGTYNWTGGKLGGAGVTSVLPGGTVNISGDGGYVFQGTTLDIQGGGGRPGANAVINWTDGNLNVGSFATIDNRGLFNVADDASILNPTSDEGTILNRGVILKPSVVGTVGTTTIGNSPLGRQGGGMIKLINDGGSFQVDAGTLDIACTMSSTPGSVTTLSGAGTMLIRGGASTSGTFLVANGSATTGRLAINGGSFSVSGGVLGVGNNGTLTSGSGNGSVFVSAGTLSADTILLGSTTGGSGDMNVSGTGHVIVRGGLNFNDVNISGGSLEVLDGPPPVSEDPVLHRALVGGWLRDGAMTVSGGAVSSPLIKMGVTSGNTGTYTQIGGAVTAQIFGVGNDATLTSGAGTGHATISGGSLYADTIVLGSTTGGTGDMTISGTGNVTVGGGLTMNTLTINGGTLTVLDQDPPPWEDAVLDRSIVGGYLRDGAMNVTAGTVTSPNIKLGVTAGKTGSYAQSGGMVEVGVFGVGNSGTLTGGAGTGVATISGGTLRADTVVLGSTTGGTGTMNVSGSANVIVGGGFSANTLNVNGGTVTVLDQDPPPGEDPVLDRSIVGGYLRDGAISVSAGVVTTPKIKLGITSGKTGAFAQSGGTVHVGYFGVGNDGAFNTGSGMGTASITGGTLHADTVVLGSTTGGTGTMDIAGTANVVVGGGLSTNTLNMNGGALTVLDQNPPPGEDPVLDRSIVGGYLRDGAMTVQGGTVASPYLKLGVSSGKTGTYAQSGGTVSVGTLLLASGQGGIGSMSVSGGSFTATARTRVEANGTLRYDGGAVALGAAELVNGGKILLSTNGSRVLRASSVSIDTTNNSLIDLSDNDAILSADNYANVSALIATARHGGAWDRGGLTSSAAIATFPRVTSLGALTGQQFRSVHGINATFGGYTVANSDVLVKYTYYGDTDFNGKVDGADYARIDATFNNEASQGDIGGWFNGDLDYNNKVDGADYALIASAFNAQNGTLLRMLNFIDGSDRSRDDMTMPGLQQTLRHFDQFGESYMWAALTSVPEPTALLFLSVLAAMRARRRR